jgi:N6-L-threonylcarbamoyladenine synthase
LKKIDPSDSKSYILAIESSCDDTGAAVFKGYTLLSNVVATQDIHEKYGGVVPEWASRKHEENIVPVVDQALQEADIRPEQLSAVAFTLGPGLLGSLLVGCSFAKTLAMSLDIPLITVNHMEAHIMAHYIEEPQPSFPFLCLTVSGGHTQLIIMSDHGKYEILGETRDDAAGEAFDKIGKYLGLSYPAGPIIDKLAQTGTAKYSFTKPNLTGYEFSYSGLKTAVLYFLRDHKKVEPDFIETNLADICCSVQTVIVESLVDKVVKASNEYDIKIIAIAGGVSANSALRKVLQEKSEEHSWELHIPKLAYCTDNAAMIGIAAYYKYLREEFASLGVTPQPRLKIS